MATYAKAPQKGKARFIVVSGNNPLFEITPFDEDETLESFYNEVQTAKSDITKGKFLTHAEVVKKLKSQ